MPRETKVPSPSLPSCTDSHAVILPQRAHCHALGASLLPASPWPRSLRRLARVIWGQPPRPLVYEAGGSLATMRAFEQVPASLDGYCDRGNWDVALLSFVFVKGTCVGAVSLNRRCPLCPIESFGRILQLKLLTRCGRKRPWRSLDRLDSREGLTPGSTEKTCITVGCQDLAVFIHDNLIQEPL